MGKSVLASLLLSGSIIAIMASGMTALAQEPAPQTPPGSTTPGTAPPPTPAPEAAVPEGATKMPQISVVASKPSPKRTTAARKPAATTSATPAQTAGLTKAPWTLQQVLAYPIYQPQTPPAPGKRRRRKAKRADGG